MIVGALLDCGQIKAWGREADVHVCRVLGRAVNGDPADSETAGKLAQELNPMDPWAARLASLEPGQIPLPRQNPGLRSVLLGAPLFLLPLSVTSGISS